MENQSSLWLLNHTDRIGCIDLARKVDWHDIAILASFLVLGLINVVVIGGNTLVIIAVYITTKLRTVTNLFIVSLAAADLLVGLAVLPFSTTYEVINIWVFGDVWCKIWLAIDVWLCTASILNLCAISLDRFLAVTRPVSYPSIMSSKRAKSLIAAVWCVSFIICLPPLVGWNDTGTGMNEALKPQSHDTSPSALFNGSWDYDSGASMVDDDYLLLNESSTKSTVRTTTISRSQGPPNNTEEQINVTKAPEDVGCRCELIADRGYRIYSALGSFYLPMLVMMFFYWRIYRAAVETTRAINQGFKTTKTGGAIGGRFDEQRLTLRIHKGRSSADFCKTNGTCGSGASFREKGRPSLRVPSTSSKVKSSLRTSVSFPPSSKRKGRSSKRRSDDGKGLGGGGQSEGYATRKLPRHHWLMVDATGTRHDGITEADSSLHAGVEGDSEHNDDRRGAQFFPRMGKRNIKAQVKRFRMETKAAKTLGIIVGGFILCWLPFFTIYLIGAFCTEDCIPSSLFSVFFWLGYCNSAINPCVYALFSRDFRHAFKKILCRCILRDEVSIKERIVTMFPPTIHLSSFGEESEGGSDSH